MGSNEDYRSLSPDFVKVMKDQDLSYVRMQKQKDRKKVERLQASLHFLDSNDGSFNRVRKSDIEKVAKEQIDNRGGNDDSKQITFDHLRKLEKRERKLAKKLAKARSGAYKEMELRRERADKMKTAEDHLITEKFVAGKGRKRKVKAEDDGRPAQYKWRRKRLG